MDETKDWHIKEGDDKIIASGAAKFLDDLGHHIEAVAIRSILEQLAEIPSQRFITFNKDAEGNNTYTEDKERDWYFTFGCGQPHEGHYHVIHDTCEGARVKMNRRFGNKWFMVYKSAEEAGVERWGLKELK